MSTAASGTFSVSCFVASRPSMPGMRTSMITTFGRRRSASAMADAPSPASPITRMCGARESDRRRPSRTTSWSSTMRQVISGGWASVDTAGGLYGDSQRQRELFRLGRRLETRGAAVADAVQAGQLGDVLAHGLLLVRAQVGPARVQPLVLGQQLGPVLLEVCEEVLTGARLQVQEVRPHAGRARGSRGADDLGEELGPVREAGQDRRQ